MINICYILLESLLLTLALSTDAFIASLSYGSNKIKIPWSSALVISSVCTGVLGVSILLGSLLKGFIPGGIFKYISFVILMLLGLVKLMDNIIKFLINRYSEYNKEIRFYMFNLKFILNIYANPSDADIDESKTLSPKEAFSLALALSLDSFAAGIGVAMGDINIVAVLAFSTFLSLKLIKLGELIGNRIRNKIPLISWLGGILLIVLAFLKLL